MLLDNTDSTPSNSELSAAAPEPLPPISDLVVTSSAPREGDLYQMGSDVIQLLPEVDSINETISVADLIIMQSSFDTFVSPRSPETGSAFIRALVVTLYKFAGEFDVVTLGELVREAVSRYGVEQTQVYLAANPGLNAAYIAQMPKMISTNTDLRKLYLRPGVNMRRAGEHPQSLTDPRYPDGSTTTTIEWLPDLETSEAVGNTRPPVRNYIRWRIRTVAPIVRPRPIPRPRTRPVPRPRTRPIPRRRPLPAPRP